MIARSIIETVHDLRRQADKIEADTRDHANRHPLDIPTPEFNSGRVVALRGAVVALEAAMEFERRDAETKRQSDELRVTMAERRAERADGKLEAMAKLVTAACACRFGKFNPNCNVHNPRPVASADCEATAAPIAKNYADLEAMMLDSPPEKAKPCRGCGVLDIGDPCEACEKDAAAWDDADSTYPGGDR